MKVLVDVNVFIDVMTKRANWQGSLRVLNEERQARADAQASVKGFRLVSLTQEIIDKALASALPDFEDNIQLASAKAIAADHIITRNKRDFQPAPISILTPEEWLATEIIAQIEARLQSVVKLTT